MPYPPTIPAEVLYTDLELDLLDNEPPGLFPSNQSSYWGQFRKLQADYLTANAVDLFTRWYNNLDPRVVDVNDIDEWEYMTDTPQAPAGFTVAQRRARVISRLYRGAFTRTQRRALVESFITQTFGAAVSFDPSGIPLDASGIPLFSGATSLAGSYAIRELDPDRNKLDNPSAEPDLVGWGSGAGDVAPTFTRVNTQNRFGSWSAQLVHNGTQGAWITETRRASQIPIVQGKHYAFSSHIRPGVGSRQVYIQIDWYNASFVGVGSTRINALIPLSAGAWKRLAVAAPPPVGAAWAFTFPAITGAGAVGDSIFADATQFEEVRNIFPYVGGEFETGLEGWYPENFGDASTVLRQITTDFAPGVGSAACMEWVQQSSNSWPDIGSPFLPALDAGKDYVLAFWAKETVGTKAYQGSLDTSGGLNTVAPVFDFVPTSSWQEVQIPFTAQNRNLKSQLFLWPLSPVGASTLRVDNIRLYRIGDYTEPTDPTAFSYEVRLLNSITVDEQGLRRELNRITPAGISYSIVYTATP